MSINQLFCTPEQGKRLKELVPELTSQLVWFSNDNGESYYHEPYFENELDGAYDEGTVTSPALTLQDLRDVVKKVNYEKLKRSNTLFLDPIDHHELENLLDVGTAPELAAWVIERLEDTP